MRAEMVGAIKDLTGEVQELRKQAPGRLAFYALSAIVLIAMVALLALVATRGVDPTTVAHAAVEASSPR